MAMNNNKSPNDCRVQPEDLEAFVAINWPANNV